MNINELKKRNDDMYEVKQYWKSKEERRKEKPEKETDYQEYDNVMGLIDNDGW